MYRKDVIQRLGAVEGEWRAATVAVSRLRHHSQNDPGVLVAATVTPADVRACLANLEPTYLVRMFAVFEESLRDIWRIVYGRKTRPETYSLIQRCAARQHIPADEIDAVHAVRDYRNSVVHGGEAPPIPLPSGRASLCKFFGRMPPQW